MPGMDMSGQDASKQEQDMHDMPGMGGDGSASAMRVMESHHMDMGPHMKMTSVRAMQPGDQEKADQIVTAARSVAEKYKGYKVALADGFKIFLPNLPQKQYHFTNYWNAFEAARHLDPSRPTSLLYEKHGEDYKLIGARGAPSERQVRAGRLHRNQRRMRCGRRKISPPKFSAGWCTCTPSSRGQRIYGRWSARRTAWAMLIR